MEYTVQLIVFIQSFNISTPLGSGRKMQMPDKEMSVIVKQFTSFIRAPLQSAELPG
jgi:hypothetical protein